MRRPHRRQAIITAVSLSIVLCAAACVAALTLPIGGVTASATVRVAIDPVPAEAAASGAASAASVEVSTQGRRPGGPGGPSAPAQRMPSSSSQSTAGGKPEADEMTGTWDGTGSSRPGSSGPRGAASCPAVVPSGSR